MQGTGLQKVANGAANRSNLVTIPSIGWFSHPEHTELRMELARPLPAYLVQRYHGWKATAYKENQVWYRHLASEGQRPRAMVISCCDSRVHVTSIFGADQGEFFIHRNIANLVPPFEPDGDHHGTSAAVEYAVCVLNVAHLIVLGHSQCGGVQGCIDMCKGHAPELEARESFVGRWMDILRPKYALVSDVADDHLQARQLEKHAVVTSLDNLMTFPFISDAIAAGSLSLHGLWTDIGEGGLEFYDPARSEFLPV
jgi:carbonic anhydrase